MRINLIKLIKESTATSRWYITGAALTVIGFVTLLINTKLIFLFELCGLLASLCFAAAFVGWCNSYLLTVWISHIGRPVLALLYALVLLLAIFPAKFLVVQAMKLPPQYFFVTVGIGTLFICPAMWLPVLSFIALFLVIFFTLTGTGTYWSFPLF
jgi:hypothetical protein